MFVASSLVDTVGFGLVVVSSTILPVAIGAASRDLGGARLPPPTHTSQSHSLHPSIRLSLSLLPIRPFPASTFTISLFIGVIA